MIAYSEDEFLLLSGIQHFKFCRRQWALIHVEQLWKENVLTVEGQQLHDIVHDETLPSEKRNDIIISRSVPVRSTVLGVSGACDIVEFYAASDGITLNGRDGLWSPVPVEYKHGRPKDRTDADNLQLCCQAMCLEEMLLCHIPLGYLYYGELRHRLEVELTQRLREDVKNTLTEMHEYYKRRYTPKVKPTQACKNCSMRDLCLPKLGHNISASTYIQRRVNEPSESC